METDMPRQIARNFRALAESQNYRVWDDLPAPRTSLERACVPQFEEASHRSQVAFLAARRDRLVDRINDAIDWPGGFTRSPYFRGLGSPVFSADDAVDQINRAICRQRVRAKHWSATPGLVPQLVEALVYARYFRRFGQRVWMRQTEAA
jgi:hypothetical protein